MVVLYLVLILLCIVLCPSQFGNYFAEETRKLLGLFIVFSVYEAVTPIVQTKGLDKCRHWNKYV